MLLLSGRKPRRLDMNKRSDEIILENIVHYDIKQCTQYISAIFKIMSLYDMYTSEIPTCATYFSEDNHVIVAGNIYCITIENELNNELLDKVYINGLNKRQVMISYLKSLNEAGFFG